MHKTLVFRRGDPVSDDQEEIIVFGKRAWAGAAQEISSASPLASAIRGYAQLALAPSEKRSRVFAVKVETLADEVDSARGDQREEQRAAARLTQEVEAFAVHQRDEVERTLALLNRGVRSAFGSLDVSVRSGEALAAAASVACENLSQLESARSYEELRQRLDKEIASLKEAIQRQAAAGREARSALANQAENALGRLGEVNAMADSDFLTQLPNRGSFGEALKLAEEPGRWVVAKVDFDGLRTVNERHGFSAGDAALIEIGHRLQSAFKGLGTISRWEDDSFAIAAKDKEPHVLTRLRTVEAELTGRPILYAGTRLPLGISFGVADLDPRSPERSLEEADRRRLLYKSTKTNRRAA